MARRVDDLGRIVIPAEMRKAFDIKEGDELAIAVEDNHLIFTKKEEACSFCRSTSDLKEFRGRMICATCIGELTGYTPEGSWEPFSQ